MDIGLPRGLYGELYHAKVERREGVRDVIPSGVENPNPITDTRLYDLEYLDCTIKTLSENVIAENLLLQVDKEGPRQFMTDAIINHFSNSKALIHDNELYSTKNGNKYRK